jgi:hypothetical protein
VATGTGSNGNYYALGSCGGWASTVGSTSTGIASNDAQTFTFAGSASCAAPARLYCFGVGNAPVVAPAAVSARHAFISENWTPGGGLASADLRCAEDATAANLSGTYKALLATSTASAIARFNTAADAAPWARPDNTLIAATAALLDSALQYLDATPNSNAASTQWYTGPLWAGADSLTGVGTSAQTCTNWMSASAGSTGLAGKSGHTKLADWRGGYAMLSCNQPHPLVCLEQ